jgi:hypothetical protein
MLVQGHYTKCEWIPLVNWLLITKVEYVDSRSLQYVW